jgi:hypothetical protein
MLASTEVDHAMTVLVLAERTDTTADLVVRELNDRGAVVFRCDAAEFPSNHGPTSGYQMRRTGDT